MGTKTQTRRAGEIETVCGVLHEYAERGIFRRYGARTLRGGRIEHKFVWLADQVFTLIHDPVRSTLVFRDLLPGIAPQSAMDRGLREFIRGRSARKLPAHRRIDPRRLHARCLNRGGKASLSLQFGAAGAEYAARKALDLVNEIFFAFLSPGHHEYLVRRFNLPLE